MANQVEIILKAVDKASGEINKVSGAGNKLAAGFKSLTGMSLGAGAAMAAVGAAAKFIGDAVNETVAYATEIDNMSRLLGISTEETSRLVQASDDLFISQETLKSGLQAAARQGIDVSIDGLKQLSEQYLSLQAGAERSEFVLKTFGRSGAEMGKLMEVGAEGIDAATAAIADNMIITQESMTSIMNYKRSVDNLNDAWFGLKMTIAQEVIPQLDLLFRQLTPGVDAIEELETRIYELQEQIVQTEKYGGMAGMTAEEVAEQVEALEAEIQRLQDELNGTVSPTEDATVALDELATTEQELIDINRQLLQESLKVSDWMEGWSGADDEAKKLDLQLDYIRDNLDQLGAAGGEVWNAFLLQTGQITPEALTEFANVEAAFLRLKGLLSAGIPVTVAVNIVMSEFNIGGEAAPSGPSAGDWVLRGTRGGPGTESAWYSESLGQWYYGDKPPGHHAVSGLGGGRTIVGEFGPEVVDLPPGSRVHSATNSAKTATSIGGFTDRDLRKLARYISEEFARSSR